MPVVDQIAENDLDVDMGYGNWQKRSDAADIYEKREFKKRHLLPSSP